MYIQMLEQTQAFSEFIYDRESRPASDPRVKLFDEVILLKKNRGKGGFFSRSSRLNRVADGGGRADDGGAETTYVQDTSEHVWATSAAPSTNPTTKSNTQNLPPPNRSKFFFLLKERASY